MQITSASQYRRYKIGDKIRISIGTEYGDHRITFGCVSSVSEENIPTVKYKDYSDIRISDFDRVIKISEVIMVGKFTTHLPKF